MKKLVSFCSAIVLSVSLMSGIAGAAKDNGEINLDAALKAANNYFQNIVETSADGLNGIPLEQFHIASAAETTPDVISLSVELTYDEFGKLPAVPYTVVKENGKFVVKNEIFSYDNDPDSPDYKKIKIGNAVERKTDTADGLIAPQATVGISGSYYIGTIAQNTYGFTSTTTYFSGQSWTNTNTSVTIHGWQTKASGEGSISLAYGVAAKLSGGGFTELKTGSYKDGDYPSSGTWPSTYLTGVATGSNRCIYVKNRSYASANVSGDAYQDQ